MKTDNPTTLIGALTGSPIYQEYERAFTAAAGTDASVIACRPHAGNT